MPKMKLTDDEFDPDELDVEYEGNQFERYDGDIPKTGTILTARVTKMWWTQSGDGDSMIKALVVAEQNDGSKDEYNGLPVWENLTFITRAAFRYQPFLENFGVTLKEIKNKMMVANDDDNIGTPIESIGGWEPGSDDALCRIVIKRERYNGEWSARIDVDGWMPYEEPDEPEEEQPRRPTRASRDGARRAASSSRGAATTSRRRGDPDEDEDEDEEYDDDVEEEDEDEEAEEEDQEEEAQPSRARGRARGGRAASTRPARTQRASSSANSGRRGAARGGSSNNRTSSGRGSERSGSARANRAAARDRRSGGSSDDPPF
jgi:hypothetical protein